jgi:hypothetical protein
MDKEMENKITEIVDQVIKRKRVAWKRLLNKKRLHWAMLCLGMFVFGAR